MKSSDGDNFQNPAAIGGAILAIGDEVDFYYSKADIQFETDDIVDFNSYKKGIELLKKYNIVIE